MSNEVMKAIICCGYRYIANKKVSQFSYDFIMNGIEHYKEYVSQITQNVVNMQQEWLDADLSVRDAIIQKYITVATDCHVFKLMVIKWYLTIPMTSEQVTIFAGVLYQTSVLEDKMLIELKKHINILATIVNSDFWHETRIKFGNILDIPWWIGEETIDQAKRLKLITN